jgi:hypothetical protein
LSVVLGIGIGLFLVAVLVGQFIVFPAMWIGFREHWRRTPSSVEGAGFSEGQVLCFWSLPP